MMKNGLIARILKRHSSDARKRGSVLRTFAKKIGLVYFGSVDQHVDEHEVIRGLTVSTTHKDDHYAVGSFDGYDVSLVDRFDIVMNPDGSENEHNWVILQITLDNTRALPHFFLKPNGHGEAAYTKFFSAYSHLKPVNSIFRGAHNPDFHQRYEVFMNSSQVLEIEAILTPELTSVIAARLWPHAIEVLDGKLYIYTTGITLTEALLSSSLQSALWLAEQLDKPVED